MTSRADFITRARRFIRDSDSPYDYEDDEEYADAIEAGLERVNFDLSTSYSDVPDVVSGHFILFRLQAFAYLCTIRAAAQAGGEESGSVSTITVPDLSISEGASSSESSWSSLHDDLLDQYDDLLASMGGSAGGSDDGSSIQQGVMVRRDRMTGAIRDSRLAEPVSHSLGVGYSVDGTEITLTWTPFRDVDFKRYEILYSSTDNPPDEDSSDTSIVLLTNNQLDEYDLDVGSSGTWYLRVDIISVNDLRTEGTAFSVSV